MGLIAKFLIFIYQKLISPLLGPRCRFYPTCSEYARLCFDRFPFHLALWYSLGRILKCNPFNDGGYDPPLEEGYCCHKTGK